MPIFEFQCNECAHQFESLMKPYDPVTCPHCQMNNATKLISAVYYKWNCDSGGSTHPKQKATQEEDRRLGKRERVTNMIKKDMENS